MNAPTLELQLSDELLEAVARRVAELLAERQAAPNGADGWLRGADAIGGYIGCPRSRVYALTSSGRMACVQRDGSALIARRHDLDAWLANGGGKRP